MVRRKCEDGKTRNFIKRQVTLSDVWNGLIHEYVRANKTWNKHSVEGDTQSLTFDEGYVAGITVGLHFLRHLKDKDIFELPMVIPSCIDVDEAYKEVKEDMERRLNEKTTETTDDGKVS